MGNTIRAGIDAPPLPEIGNGKTVWNIHPSQIDALTELRGQEMLQAVQKEARLRGVDPLSLDLSGIARKAGGKVFVDGVEYKTESVSKSMEDLLAGGESYPKISPKIATKDTARGARTAVADSVVEYWALKLDRNGSWPKGKSLKGYEKWLRTTYETAAAKDAEEFTKKYKYQVDRGHAAQGPNARSMLSPQLRWGEGANRTTAQWYIVEEGDTLDSISKKQSVAPKMIEEMNEKTKGIGKKGVKRLRAGELEPGTRIKLFQITSNLEHARGLEDLGDADIAITHARAFEEYLFEGKNDYTDRSGKRRSVSTMEAWTPEELQAVHHRVDYAASAEAAQSKIRLKQLQKADAKAKRLASVSTKASGKLSKADATLRLAAAVTTGDLVGGSLAAGQLTMQHALRNPAVQKNISKQVARIVAERGAKSAAKMMPGLDIALSAAEAGSYLSEGKWDQAAIATVSGAIGWMPLIGDGAAAALDLTNTGIDIARLDWDKQPEIVETPTADQRQTDYQDTMARDYVEEARIERLTSDPAPQRVRPLPGPQRVGVIRRITGALN